ncbi:SMI1/KNR4 family protein [Streptomyces sp. NPDC005151]
MLNSLPAGAPPERIGADLPDRYREFLAVCDGATCGDVTVFDAATVDSMQFYADPIDAAEVNLGREEWFCLGVVSDEPFFVNRSTGAVWYFPDTGVEWWKSAVFERAADDFTTFFLEWVAGPRYMHLTGSQPEEQWPELLGGLGRLGG